MPSPTPGSPTETDKEKNKKKKRRHHLPTYLPYAWPRGRAWLSFLAAASPFPRHFSNVCVGLCQGEKQVEANPFQIARYNQPFLLFFFEFEWRLLICLARRWASLLLLPLPLPLPGSWVQLHRTTRLTRNSDNRRHRNITNKHPRRASRSRRLNPNPNPNPNSSSSSSNSVASRDRDPSSPAPSAENASFDVTACCLVRNAKSPLAPANMLPTKTLPTCQTALTAT